MFIPGKLKRMIVAAGFAAAVCSPAMAEEQRVLAVVNDHPVTTLDVEQHIRLSTTLLGEAATATRAKVLEEIINEIVKIDGAKAARMEVTPVDVDGRLTEISKGMKLDRIAFEKNMQKNGIGITVVRRYFAAQMSFARLLRFKYREDIKVDEQDIDRKLEQIKAELANRVKKAMAGVRAIDVYSLREINFPVENAKDPAAGALLQSRALEANQFLSRFKGCDTAQSAAAGIFNVKLSKTFEADGARLPPQLRKLMDSKGPGHAYGPMRAPSGIQVIAFCGKRHLEPPKPNVKLPTRDQVKQAAISDKYRAAEAKYVSLLRKNAIVEYKDQSAEQE